MQSVPLNQALFHQMSLQNCHWDYLPKTEILSSHSHALNILTSSSFPAGWNLNLLVKQAKLQIAWCKPFLSPFNFRNPPVQPFCTCQQVLPWLFLDSVTLHLLSFLWKYCSPTHTHTHLLTLQDKLKCPLWISFPDSSMQSGISELLICASVKTFTTFSITLSSYVFRSSPKMKLTIILNKMHRGMTPN